ncbi:hypothetical protein DFA_01428 [Cavenderia fasciculata]|uniref:Uncharacterized protein n=1 Tax=Cavenderia fasciculata TaxID=261658 RepID=F4PSR4_CACFS|nr:uncharacterized protein DFA_01428 [Cavenderia fasciculata]EGG21542.1 hypothetical protein DFA_01428 [Cavenderia fasciculata]|eukprot:XP_004359392.1 hypothetical protein DFA_01428 [Cavenderia fasciculata]
MEEEVSDESISLEEEEEEEEEELDESIEIEVVQHGRVLIEHSNQLMNEIKAMESGKELFQEGKTLVDTIMKKEEAKQLMEKGMELLAKAKQNKEAQAILGEYKDVLNYFKNEEKVKDMLQQGKNLLESIKSKDATVTREQIESLFKNGSSLIKEFKDKEQSSLYIERMKKMFFDIKEEEKTRITIQKGIAEGKKWVDSLKEKDPTFKSIVDEGEEIFNQLKGNKEVTSLLDDGKSVLLDFLSDDSKHFSRDSPEIKALIERGGKLATNVHEQIKSNKLVGEITQKEDFKNILEKGGKFVKEVKSKQQLIDFLKQNKDFIKEIKNTIVPFITDQLLKVQIPTVNGVAKGFKYSIAKLVFAGLGIKPENVNVDFGENNKSITVSVNDFTAQLKNFEWSFNQEGFPYFKDVGTANADASRGRCSITFEIETKPTTEPNTPTQETSIGGIDSPSTSSSEVIKSPPNQSNSLLNSTPEIKITEIVFNIEQLEVIIQKGKAKWLYNLIISKFSETITTTVETRIKNTITQHLNTLTTKINELVGEYWLKLVSKFTPSNSPQTDKITTIENTQDEQEQEKEEVDKKVDINMLSITAESSS